MCPRERPNVVQLISANGSVIYQTDYRGPLVSGDARSADHPEITQSYAAYSPNGTSEVGGTGWYIAPPGRKKAFTKTVAAFNIDAQCTLSKVTAYTENTSSIACCQIVGCVCVVVCSASGNWRVAGSNLPQTTTGQVIQTKSNVVICEEGYVKPLHHLIPRWR